jgi:hypothetical protein
MKRRIKHISIWTLLAFVPTTLRAGTGGDQLGFTTYYFSDSGKNSVVTTSFNLAKKIAEQTLLMFDIELDQVTVPAVTAVTGATRPQRRKDEPFEKNRGQIIVGLQQGVGDGALISGSYYRSQEVDYVSNSFVGTYTQEMNDKNTTLTVRGQASFDLVGEILESGELVQQRKNTYNGAATLAQILSPNTVWDLGYDFVLHKGFLSDPYRQVKISDGLGAALLVDELHPTTRGRHAVSTKLSQFIPPIKASVIGSYRFYFDSWKMKSHTAELRFNKYILRDLVFGMDYRYYTQSGAYFFSEQYNGAQFATTGLRTSDYKLKPFTSNNFGFSLSYLLRGLAKANPDLEFLQDSAVELMYFRYFNDLDFSADIVQMSIKFQI